MERALRITALVAGALAVLLGIVATQVPWAEAQESDDRTEYHAFAAAVDGPAQSRFFVRWSDGLLDPQGGVDALRAGGPLLVAGIAFIGLGTLAMEHVLWFNVRGARGAAALATGMDQSVPPCEDFYLYVCGGWLGRHEMPTALDIREELPKTPIGKLSKKELVAEEQQKYEASKKQAAGSD